MRLGDVVALVTGGGSGIGQAIAERYAREGAAVIVGDRYGDRAQVVADGIVAAGGRAIACEADVREAAAVNAMADAGFAAYGRIDILVNNAGLSAGSEILSIDEETWDLNFDIMLKGAFLCSKALLPGMIERGRGNIINIVSVNGLSGIGEMPYSAAKAGLINLTQNMAVRYGPKGVRVNAIAPGTIATPIWGERLAKHPDTFDVLAGFYPLRRVGTPEDIANAALFLASDEASWITGVTLPVEGGLLAGSDAIAKALGAE